MSEPTITVVLIEDEKQIRRFVRMSLEGEGWPCTRPKPASRAWSRPRRAGPTWSSSISACPTATAST